MIESFDLHPAVDVAEAEYLRLLGYPRGHRPEGRAQALLAWARAWYAEHGRPWVYLREAPLEFATGALRIDGREFRSAQLLDHLRAAGATRVVLVAASAGRGCEDHARRLWQDARPDEYFFLEVFGSAVVEQLVATTSGRICDAAAGDDLVAVPHYSPGYAGWDVADQGRLFELIAGGLRRDLPGPLEVMESGMLRPKKSLLAVFGLAPRASAAAAAPHVEACARCSFSPCLYRRTAYRPVPARVDGAPAPAAATEPRYTVNARALRKWACERLRLDVRPDGSLAATFRFEGTTCSNLGHPIAFDYHVELAGAAEDHRVLAAECRPAAGDAGHTRMCAYIADAPELLRAIGGEKPLLGRPLDAVLGWERAASPSGCLCEARARTHIWGLALETIHFAVAQRAGAAASGPARRSA